MKTIRLEGHIFAQWYKWDDDFRFTFFAYDSVKGYIKVAPYTIEIEMPEGLDLNTAQLEVLQEKRKLILAENQSNLNKIDEEIQSLLAIENHAEVL